MHDSGARSADAIAFLVLHCTQQAAEDPAKPLSARGVARYFATELSESRPPSTQLVVSDLDCYRTLPDLVVPWGAPPLNRAGVHVEICGRAEWSRARWLLHVLAIRRAAYKGALRCRRYGIPTRLLDAGDLTRIGANPGHGRGGATTHAAVSQAFGETDHTDPGAGFPIGLYMRLLRRYVSSSAP